jgi:hypothetical protein
MGGLCKPNVDLTPSSSEVIAGTEIPEWVSKSGQELFFQAQGLAEQPFQAFQGPRVQDFSADQQTAFDLTRAATGNYLPQFGAATANAARGITAFDQNAANQYMNPYNQNVTDIATREMNRQFDMQRINDNAAAVGAGGFGGGRHAILNAENERNRNLVLSDMQLKAQQQGYENAQSMFMSDQARALQGAGLQGQLAQSQQALAAGDSALMQNIGAQQQALGQQSLDTAYADYVEQREYPYRQTNFALGALKGTPYETRNFTQTTGVTPQLTTSPFGQAAGGLAGLVGASQLFKTP